MIHDLSTVFYRYYRENGISACKTNPAFQEMVAILAKNNDYVVDIRFRDVATDFERFVKSKESLSSYKPTSPAFLLGVFEEFVKLYEEPKDTIPMLSKSVKITKEELSKCIDLVVQFLSCALSGKNNYKFIQDYSEYRGLSFFKSPHFEDFRRLPLLGYVGLGSKFPWSRLSQEFDSFDLIKNLTKEVIKNTDFDSKFGGFKSNRDISFISVKDVLSIHYSVMSLLNSIVVNSDSDLLGGLSITLHKNPFMVFNTVVATLINHIEGRYVKWSSFKELFIGSPARDLGYFNCKNILNLPFFSLMCFLEGVHSSPELKTVFKDFNLEKVTSFNYMGRKLRGDFGYLTKNQIIRLLLGGVSQNGELTLPFNSSLDDFEELSTLRKEATKKVYSLCEEIESSTESYLGSLPSQNTERAKEKQEALAKIDELVKEFVEANGVDSGLVEILKPYTNLS